jgi:hypothetical protein
MWDYIGYDIMHVMFIVNIPNLNGGPTLGCCYRGLFLVIISTEAHHFRDKCTVSTDAHFHAKKSHFAEIPELDRNYCSEKGRRCSFIKGAQA